MVPEPKTIFVLGATGELGLYVCHKALERGHSLSIFARNASKLPKTIIDHPSVKVTEGQLSDHEMLASAIKGSDVIISALGPPYSYSGLQVAPGSYINTYRAIFKVMRASSIKRIFVMGTPSIHVSEDKYTITLNLMIWMLRLFANKAWSEVVSTGRLLDEEASDLDWTMYRIGNLSNKDGTTKAASYIGEGDWCLDTYRPGIASWLLDQVERLTPEFIRQKPTLYSHAA